MSQGLVVTLLGGATLKISLFSSTYVNYVKPGFRPFLIAAGIGMLVLGAVRLLGYFWSPAAGHADAGSEAAAARPDGHTDHDPVGHADHDHGRGPRVAWLLCLPVLVIFVIAPPALGSYAAVRTAGRPVAPPPPAQAFFPLPADRITDLTMAEFAGRAAAAPETMRGLRIRLTGFVTDGEAGAWYVGRMQMACCAADAVAYTARVRGAEAPPPNSWIRVTGTFVPAASAGVPTGMVAPELAAESIERIREPAEPYE
ncbi:TIGR03943 family protein [Sphaerisporangium sp. NPDC051011]|uniref:TIGR03943 family putative permease subunit n=1 Tax=Sphaerisporangium sp. NPDC051011 TaxID=3155792 RepID=UPI0033C98263